MKKYKIAVIPGDGIGPEVTSSAVKVMRACADKFGFELDFKFLDAGGCAIDKYGIPLPEETLSACKESDAVLLGAVGGPKWDNVSSNLRPEKALLGLRKELGLYANLRPALLFDELKDACPIKGKTSIDILIVRELTGGIYFGDRGRNDNDYTRAAFDTESYNEDEIRRILVEGFNCADKRRKKLTVVDKANVLETSRLWREITNEVAPSYPDVEVDFLYVDNAAMQLIARPETFDVIVTSNMFGDILSDEAGEITGSIGMLPSGSLGRKDEPGMYEPVHGSAPDIAGLNKANPLAAILSASMLFKWSLNEFEASDLIESAVRKVLQEGIRTADISYGNNDKIVGTDVMTSEVLKYII